MTDESLAFAPAGELRDLISKKEISLVELTELFLRRTEAFNPSLNAYLTVAAEGALDDGSYTGSMGFTFSGMAKVVQDRDHGRWNMEAEERLMEGGIHATIDVVMAEPSPGVTDLNITADVQFMGKLGQMGQPLIKRKADAMIKEFAEGLKRAVGGS